MWHIRRNRTGRRVSAHAEFLEKEKRGCIASAEFHLKESKRLIYSGSIQDSMIHAQDAAAQLRCALDFDRAIKEEIQKCQK